jgi:Protein of unknown function (DUF5818)
MKHLIASLLAVLLAVSALSAAPRKQTFTGTITDNMCATGGHASMRMGPTDAECTIACIGAHGATYVLLRGKDVYILSDQRTPEQFAGQRVRIVGTLDAKTRTIQVDSIRPATSTGK